MQKLKPISISDILSKPQVGHTSVISHCNELTKINKYVSELLPSPLKNHCGVASFYGVKITLYASTPAWSYKLRFHARAIVKYLTKKGIPIKKVRFIVIPETNEFSNTLTRNLPKPTLTSTQIKTIKKAAESIKDLRLRSLLINFTKD